MEAVGRSGLWHPVTWLSLMLDYQIFGLNPQGYHLINLLFHVLNAVFLFLIFYHMTKTAWQSAFVALLFAIHPLHVESVAWIAERKDVLSSFFWMLTLGAYCYYVEYPGWRRYCLVLLFFALGLMAKPMLVTLPFVLLLLDYWPLQRFQKIKADQKSQTEGRNFMNPGKQKGKAKKMPAFKGALAYKKSTTHEGKGGIYLCFLEKVPLFFMVICFSVVAYITEQEAGAVQVGAFTLSVRITNALISYVAYIGKTIWPSNLAVFYLHPGSWPLWMVLGAALLLIAITVIIIRMIRRCPYLAMGWFWYLGTLVPVIGFVQVGEFSSADRYTYIPLIGLFIMAAWGFPELMKKWRYRSEIIIALFAPSIVILSIVTWGQVGYWQDTITLFEHDLEVAGPSALAYNTLGIAQGVLGNYGEAVDDLNRAIEINPNYADAYYNRGITYNGLGNYNQAIADFNRAIVINPGIPDAYYYLSVSHLGLGNYEQAIHALDRAIELNPNFADAYYSRGLTQGMLGNYALSVADLIRAAKYGNRNATALLKRQGIN